MKLDLSIGRGLERYEPILRAGLTAVGWRIGRVNETMGGTIRLGFYNGDYAITDTDERASYWNVDIKVGVGRPQVQIWDRYTEHAMHVAPPHVQEIATKLHHIVLVLL